MLFEKDKSMRIVDMCKWIDDNIYTKELTDDDRNRIIRYLYFIIHSFCRRRRYFEFENDCDNFSMSFAENMYYRLIDTRQFEGEEPLDKIISVKNYINKVLSGRIVTWQNSNQYSELLEDTFTTEEKHKFGKYIDTTLYKQELKDSMNVSYKCEMQRAVINAIEDLPNIIHKVCSLTQYKNDSLTVERLYMSCLLSFINWVTLSNTVQTMLDEKKDVSVRYNSLLSKSRVLNFDDNVILWHLDTTMENLIRVLLNRIKKMFIENIYDIRNKIEVSDDLVDYATSIKTVSEGGISLWQKI